MTMFTRCTACGATFRVTLEHLQASAGQVRCGVCQTVFDAFVSLSANDPRSVAPGDDLDDGPAVPAAVPTAQDAGAQQAALPAGDAPAPRAPRPEPTVPATRGASPSGGGADASAAGPAVSEPEAPEPLAPIPAQPHARAADAAHGFQAHKESPAVPAPAHSFEATLPAPRTRGGVWAVASLLLCLVAALQAAYFLRAELAARVPVLRPWLEQACMPLGCEVPLPRATDQLSIEGSDLQALDPARPGRVLLTATIRNRAPFTQAWPMLELTLTNARDQVGIRRVFGAAEYLAPAAPGMGIGPGAEATVKMRLEAKELQPAGYRLYLFHP